MRVRRLKPTGRFFKNPEALHLPRSMLLPRWFSKFAHRVIDVMARWVGVARGGHAGRLLVLPDRRHVKVFGNTQPYVRPVFRPASRVRYGWQELEFVPWPQPDFPRLLPPSGEGRVARVLCVILAHEAEAVARSVKAWVEAGFCDPMPFVVFGGTLDAFNAVDYPRKIRVDDARLRRTPPPAGKQSYHSVFEKIREVLSEEDSATHILFAEYDLLPLRKGLPADLHGCLEAAGADVLFPALSRVDGTNCAHYLYHLQDPTFTKAWSGFSIREEREAIFNALVVASFWKREAWLDVAERRLESEVYLEIEIPTTLHHLGYRMANYPPGWTEYVQASALPEGALAEATASGAPWLHPWKTNFPDSI